LGVYLPILLLIPDNFRYPIEGLPDPTFSQAALIPIGVAVCWRALAHRDWTFTSLDACVFAFICWQFISDFYNVGYVDAKNLFYDMVTMAFLPYVCGKALLRTTEVRTAFAKRFVLLLFAVTIVSIYEFRMGTSLFRPLLEGFFPGQSSSWYTQLRWGFGRTAGPYGHAILMGCIVAIALLLCVWLARTQQWERHFRILGQVYFTKQQILMACLLLGLAMTLSRGPWLGGVCGLIIAAIGFSSNPRWAVKRNFAVLALILFAAYSGGKAYLNGPEEMSEVDAMSLAARYNTSEVEQSTAYRAILFDKYVDIVMKRPVWGWGRANWPQVHGMSSIDNNYLFIALNTGLLGVGMFLAMLLLASWRLLRAGLSPEEQNPTDRALYFTLFGVIASIGITTASVFMGSQLYPLLFVFLGWADACVIGQREMAQALAIEQESERFDLVGVVA
jgi:O-antigen ligase